MIIMNNCFVPIKIIFHNHYIYVVFMIHNHYIYVVVMIHNCYIYVVVILNNCLYPIIQHSVPCLPHVTFSQGTDCISTDVVQDSCAKMEQNFS